MARIPDIPDEYRVTRIRRWQTPPNWSTRDWHEELDCIEAAAAWQATQDFDSSLGIPLTAHVRRRILTAAYSRYRQEWGYMQSMSVIGTGTVDDYVRVLNQIAIDQCISILNPNDRLILRALFGARSITERQTADSLGVSHQAVNKRKQKALARLKKCLGSKEDGCH